MEKTTIFLNFQDRKGNYELVKVLNATPKCLKIVRIGWFNGISEYIIT